MSDMVEKVAIALFCADSTNPHDPFEWKTSMINERGRERWRGLARAAIEAMREPTDEMKEAGSAFVYEAWGHGPTIAREAWQANIDAALGKVDA